MKHLRYFLVAILLLPLTFFGNGILFAATPALEFTLSNNKIQTHKPAGTEVGFFSITLPDVAESYTYSLVVGDGVNDIDNGSFYITNNVLYAASVVDYNSVKVAFGYKIFVQVMDSKSNLLGIPFTIWQTTTTGPYSIELSSTVVDLSAPVGTTVGTFTTVDDFYDQFIYSLVSGDGSNDLDNDKFTINNNTLVTDALLSTSTLHINVKTKEVKRILLNNNLQDFTDFTAASSLLPRMLSISYQQELSEPGQIFNAGVDQAFFNFLRLYWTLQEISTDEAIMSWDDAGYYDLNKQTWTNDNLHVRTFKELLLYNILFCNEFIGACGDSRLATLSLTPDQISQIKLMEGQARFYRALTYYSGLDIFGEFPIVPETLVVGDALPQPSTKQELFNFVESELLATLNVLPSAGTQYGEVNITAVRMLLAKLYLNAEVYINQSKYSECINYTGMIINSGNYMLNASYSNLFKADNDNSTEIILPIVYNGVNTQTYGGTTFLMSSAVGGTMVASDFGIDGGWSGIRTRKALVEKFGADLGTDSRALFYTDGQTLDVTAIGTFTNGYGVVKFKNVTSTGAEGSNRTFVDTDFPLFRLGDVYLMYAEAVLRGGLGGDIMTALSYVNALRARANVSSINPSELTLDFILTERARELYWEGHRRTDLIRFGKFTGSSYVWEWKGGVQVGTSTNESFNNYPYVAPEVRPSSISQSFIITTNTTSEKPIKSDALIISPNPTKEVIRIDGLKGNLRCNYSVFSADGQLLLNGKLVGNQINIEGLPAGNYLLKVDDGQEVNVKQFIKR